MSNKPFPRQLEQLLRGFRASRILLSAVELDLFSAVGNGANLATISRKISASRRGSAILLDALVSLKLLKKEGDHYFNSSLANQYLRSGAPDDWRLGLGHQLSLWDSWSQLTDCVKNGQAANRGQQRSDWQESFIGLMHQLGSARSGQFARAINLSGVKQLLDLGGGPASYSLALAAKKKDLQVTLFDLPQVTKLARRYVAKAGFAKDRYNYISGDMTLDDFGSGYDMILISNICHMLSAAENCQILRKTFAALNNGGQVVIQDFLLDDSRTRPAEAALFAVNMLVNTARGNSYTKNEYKDWLSSVGFKKIIIKNNKNSYNQILLASKPATKRKTK